MRKELTNIVYPILGYGLLLRDRLLRGEDPKLPEEQVLLRSLINREGAALLQDYYGVRTQGFHGARYLLTCWLDELMIDGTSEWGNEWAANSLGWQFYRSNSRAWEFYVTTNTCETLAEWLPAKEVAFLCLLLGFQGDPSDPEIREFQWPGDTPADQRYNWVKQQQRPLTVALGQGQPMREGQPPPPADVEPLLGAAHYQRMVGLRMMMFIGAILAAVLATVLIS